MTPGVLLISGMPPTRADPQDDAYLNEVGAQDITQYSSGKLIKIGHAVCTYEADGAAPWQVQNGLIGSGIDHKTSISGGGCGQRILLVS